MGKAEQQLFITKSRLPKGSHKGRQMSHNQATGRYVRQRSRTLENKFMAQQKHLVLHPNDLQAIKNISKSIG